MTFDRPLGSRYVLGALLGRGSMGQVYHAKRLADGQQLAVKLLREDWSDDDEIVRRFLQEKRVLASLDHPNIVKVLDLVIDGGHAGIVMELVAGGDLRRLMKRGPMTSAQAATLGRQLSLALDTAHTASVVHGDVKPENVLVAATDPTLSVKLSDFGIARLVDATATKSSSRVGTPTYMAPELVTGERVGPGSDIYSLGVLLYEALAGHPPFRADSPMALWHAHAYTQPSQPDGIGEAWWGLLQRMLAKSAGDRPTAREVAAALATGAEPDLRPISSTGASGEPTLLPVGDADADTPASDSLTGRATVLKRRDADGRPVPPVAVKRRPGARRLAVGSAAVAVLLAVLGSVAWANRLLPSQAGADGTVVAAPSASGTTEPSSTPPTAASPSAPGPMTSADTRAPSTDRSRPPSTSGSRRSAPLPSPHPGTTSKPSTTRTDTTQQCRAASNPGGLDIGPELNNSGGPNFVPQPCTAIWLKLTEVYYITYARACLENATGTDTRCGQWVYLKDNGAWNRLLDGVSAGDRWQLYLKAEGPGHVGFQFSG